MKRNNEHSETEGHEKNEFEMRMRSSTFEAPRSCRRESAVPARPEHRLGEQSACEVVRNPPRYLGDYRAKGSDPAVHWNAPRIAQTHS